MEMMLHESDKSSQSKAVDTSEAFNHAKKKLEEAILEFDETLRLKFSGSYKIEIVSPYLTSENISYTFSNSGQDSSNSFVPKDPTIVVSDKITRPVLEFCD